jgi:hypothetical protein
MLRTVSVMRTEEKADRRPETGDRGKDSKQDWGLRTEYENIETSDVDPKLFGSNHVL